MDSRYSALERELESWERRMKSKLSEAELREAGSQKGLDCVITEGSVLEESREMGSETHVKRLA